MRIIVKRHLMPLTALGVFLGAALPFAPKAPFHVALGTVLFLLYWLVEWRGIEGDFQDEVPRHPLIIVSRILWLPGLALSVLDTLWWHWTPWQGPFVRIAGVAVYLIGLALRLWSMRALGDAFSYDLKVREGQALKTTGPYAVIRHPSYTGLLLWSVGVALFNPSIPGLAVILITTVPQMVYRIRIEEQMMRERFGEKWLDYCRTTSALVPFVW
jgi:protein-S-isoprenylcysteine O-methyltransferase Ste14